MKVLGITSTPPEVTVDQLKGGYYGVSFAVGKVTAEWNTLRVGNDIDEGLALRLHEGDEITITGRITDVVVLPIDNWNLIAKRVDFKVSE